MVDRSAMSSNFNTSNNYIWSTTAVLGKGATGYVYQGFSKHNGEAVAVKTFNHASKQRPDQVQMREFEVLQRVDHENIVRLLAVEEEGKTRSRILVMELCTGSSLFSILDDPENTFGLPEEEFLLVLKHTSDGMNYLRANHIVHRDLKPGNIMKYITKDNRSVYKLTDFGAARELDDDQQFVSLYGTEEYLHPDMYERAVLRKDARKSFSAAVDLWSIGVTLYHVATGALPFRPYGGRRNCETMHKITTQKASGIISGIQHSLKGPIEWSDQLPPSCQLSAGLRKHMTPMLAGLMECNPNLMWSFDHFFTEVTNLMQKLRLNVFYVDQCRSLIIYANPNYTMENFKLLIKEQTHVAPEKQRIFLKHKSFDEIVDAKTVVSDYPKTSAEKPIFLIGFTFPVIAYESQPIELNNFMSSTSPEQDAISCKLLCSSGYSVKRQIEQIDLTFRLLKSFAQTMNLAVKSQFLKLKSVIDTAEKISISATQKMKVLQSRHKTTVSLLDLCGKLNPTVMEERNKLQVLLNNKQESNATVLKHFNVIKTRYLAGYEKVVLEEQLWNQWKISPSFQNDLSRCPAFAITYVRILKNSWQQFERNRKPRATSYAVNEPVMIYERLRVEDSRQELARLYQDQCIPTLQGIVKDLGQWLSLSQRALSQAENVDIEIVGMLAVHDSSLDEANETYDEMVLAAAAISDGGNRQIPRPDICSTLVDGNPSLVKSSSLTKLVKTLKEIQYNDAETLNLLQMNQLMINKLAEASTAMTDSIEKGKV